MSILILSVLILSFGYVITDPVFSKSKHQGTYQYSLKSHKGKRSVLLFFSDAKKDANFQKQLEVLDGQDKYFRGKKTVLYYVFKDENGRADDLLLRPTDGDDLRKSLKVKSNSFTAILINREGKEVARRSEPLSMEAIKKLIK